MSPDTPPRPAPLWRWLVLAAVVLLAAGLGLAALLVGGGDGERSGDAAATSSAAAAPTVPPEPPTLVTADPPPTTPAPTGPTSDANELPPSLPAVPLDGETTVEDDVAVTLEGIEAIEGAGSGAGNVAGPALRVTVEVRNATTDPVDLSGAAVDLSYGADRVPGPPLDDPSAAPFSGTLGPGGTARGVYVFRVPAEERGSVTVSVGYRPGAPYAVFTGAAP